MDCVCVEWASVDDNECFRGLQTPNRPIKMNSNAPHSRPASLLNGADRIGSVLSSLCAVHCLCMPLLIGLLPMIGATFLGSQKFERIACVTMVLLAAACIWSGCRIHRRWGLSILLSAGTAVVLFTQFAGPPEPNAGQAEWPEVAAMVIGGLLIAVSHVINLKLRADCRCSQCEAIPKK
jgi:hypothetical protein